MITAKAILLTLMSINSSTFNYSHLNEDQAYCLAVNIYHESRAENIEGQFAVANSTIERVKDPRFPNTICGVVLAGVPDKHIPGIPAKHKCAFSWNCDRKSDEIRLYYNDETLNKISTKAFINASVVALMSINKEVNDFCEGANFYYNPSIADPTWAQYYTEKCNIGNHTFLRREVGSLK